MQRFTELAKQKMTNWLGQGMSPRRLALTLALGFAIGCIPVIGIPTVVCATVALTLRLNLPAIQAANYAAMPLQFVLIVPFMRLGRWLVSAAPSHLLAPRLLLQMPMHDILARMGTLAAQALLAWVLVAIPAVALITIPLSLMLRRIPSLAASEAGD